MRLLRLRMSVLGLTAVAVGGAILGFVGDRPAASTPDRPGEPKSLLGSYLAGRFARGQYDMPAAVSFYRAALARDADSDLLLEQALLTEATEANWPLAVQHARRLVEAKSDHRMARMVLGVDEFKARNWTEAEEHFRISSAGPIGELTGAMARAWIRLARNDVDGALDLLQSSKHAEWAQFFLRYHRALVADVGGRRVEARTSFERSSKGEARTARTTLAFARHAANGGDVKLAKSIVKEHLDRSTSEGHPMVRALRDELNAGGPINLQIETPEEGLAEVLYGLGETLSSEGGISLGTFYLQLALSIRPDFPFALAALASVHETTKRHTEAIEIYDRIPKGTPLESSIEIRKAVNLNLLERVDEATRMLETLAERDPTDIRALETLGNIMRARKRYPEAVDHYTRAMALIAKPEKRHWMFWYSRGTCYERAKKWPQAEADLQRALQLAPDEPLVLNYLGYSWIDQGKNLKPAMSLIEKAVALKPDDGYIVDSLGWAHFKLANYKEAVRFLERAVELRPEDPVLNDHLGDALWRVGRTREARFQWDQALTLKPESEDLEKIKKKLDRGLPSKPVARTAKKTKDVLRADPQKKRIETKLGPSPFQ